MCLWTIDKSPPRHTSGTGYKLYTKSKTDGMVYAEYFGPGGGVPGEPMKIGEWMDAVEVPVSTGYFDTGNPKYTSGFHIYKKFPKDLLTKYLRAYKVEYKEAHTSGIQNDLPVVVARKVKIIEEVDPK